MKTKPLLDPLTVQIAGRAFDDARRRMAAPASEEELSLMARRILGTASLGERDPALMRDDALSYITS